MIYSGDDFYGDDETSGLEPEDVLSRAARLADSLANEPAFGRDPDLIAAEVVRQMPELARPPAYAVGDYVEVEQTYTNEATIRGIVLVTSIEDRGDYRYVGWRNRDPQGGWNRELGFWGYFREYRPEPRPFGTRVVRVVEAGS